MDVRVLRQEFREPGPEYGVGCVLGGRDADGAGGLVAQFAQGGQFGFDFVEPGCHRGQQTLACFGGRNAARGAREQPQAQSGVQRADRMAQRRLRHAELRGRSGETAFARYRDEGKQVIEIVARHACVCLMAHANSTV